MPTPQATRRFAPTPIETTTRSSKQNQTAKPPVEQKLPPPPRRFVPDPIETTIRSSRDLRPNSPETGDLHTLKKEHKARRFAPQVVEITKRSSQDKKKEEEEEEKEQRQQQPNGAPKTKDYDDNDKEAENKPKPKPRKFAVQPVETTHVSSKDKQKKKQQQQHEDKPHIKFTPQLTEKSTQLLHSRQSSTDSTGSVSRKFTPVLIESSQRSRRAANASTTSLNDLSKSERDRHAPANEDVMMRSFDSTTRERMDIDEQDDHPRRARNTALDLVASEGAILRSISPFDGSSRRAKSQQRQHSFRCPDLDTIESSESDRGESDTSSLPGDAAPGSPITASDSSFNNEYKHATRMRESIDENFANYFLELEAQRAEKRLREQALAAFPNSDFHEPVQHYVNEERDSESSDESIDYRPVTYDEDEDNHIARAVRRESTKVPWEQLEMQRHAERLDQDRKANAVTAAPAPPSQTGPWWNPAYNMPQVDQEMRSMRDRARPPMLGRDLAFRRCQSPEPARFDVTQGSVALRKQMSLLTEQSEAGNNANSSPALWTNPATKAQDSIQSTITSASTSSKGLWGGFCTSDAKQSLGGLAAPPMPSGLMTPRHESLNPFDQSFTFNSSIETSDAPVQTPPTPASSDHTSGPISIDGVLTSERQLDDMIEDEFPDSFVTQVYNYLSLGYPSLARPYDEELCKISHISIAELRQDDQRARASPRGYIRLGPDFEGGGGIDREENCRRWVALKAYIREWAKQEKTTSNFDGPGMSGAVPVRRGSWGN